MSNPPALLPDPNAQPFMSATEVARALRTSRDAVYDAIARGDLPVIRVGARKGYRIPTTAVRRMAGLDSQA